MFRSLQKSWEIAKVSFGLLMADKKLLVFPVLSGLVLLLVVASFGLPLAALGIFKGVPIGIFAYVLGFLFYFLAAFVIIFFNSALVGAVNLRMQGHDPTLGDGIRCAWQRRAQIAGYAAISATVGLLLRMLKKRGGFISRIAAFFGGLAWALATYVAIPVLVVEGLGPIDAIRRSTTLIKNTWGHQVAGHVGFGVFHGAVSIVLFAIGFPTIWFSVQAGWWPVTVTIITLLVVVHLLTSLVFATLATIYSTAVFRYATTGETSGFSQQLINA